MVEAALVLFVSLIIMMAILDFGQVLLIHQALVERVRSGARYAVVHGFTTVDDTAAKNRITGVVLFNDPCATGTTGMFGVTSQMVEVTRSDLGGNLANDDEGADRVTVAINNYQYYLFTPGITGRYTAKPIVHSITVENLGIAPGPAQTFNSCN